MKHLLIIGARGAGREIYMSALNTKEFDNGNYDIKGFLDDKNDSLYGYNGYPPIIDSVENYKVADDDVFVCALGNPIYRKKYVEIILEKGGRFINIIEKTADIGLNSTIGIGCIIRRDVIVSCDCKLGNFIYIQPYSCIGHDCVIGNFCHLNTYSFMGGYCKLGDSVTIQTNGMIVPHKRAFDGSVIGAGSVAIRNVQKDTTVFGIPARKLDY